VSLKRDEGQAEISVSDSGAGISPDFLPFVFDRFRQADSSSTRTHGGLGLGLAIVRNLVELHGGTVRAESQGAGHGATFIVRLPRQTTTAEAFVAEAPEPPSRLTPEHAQLLSGVRVLVVDDESDTRDLLTALLAQASAEVRVAESAGAALEAFDAWSPDIIVSDIAMPDGDGYDLIRHIRARSVERGGRIPAIALTAYARLEDRLRVLAAGFQIHIAKPVEPAELITVIASLTGRLAGETK
jgi:CheY-like chemotaxis protein